MNQMPAKIASPSVAVKELHLAYGSVNVLNKLDLDIAEGEFIVLLGPSGCGKSTLLNCIAGLLDITDGQIFIKGKNVTWEEPKDRGIGMVFQSYALYPQMSVEGNLSFGLRNAGMAKEEIGKRVTGIDGVRDVRNDIDVLPVSSSDEHLRRRIARAIYGNPSFWNYAAMAQPPIHIIVEHGRVTLTGVVNNNVERMLARSLATGYGELSVENALRTDAEVRLN